MYGAHTGPQIPMRIPQAVRLYKEALIGAFPGLTIGNDLSNRTSTVSASTSWTIWPETSSGKTRRCSAADALLWAPSQQRAKLTVLANHTVSNIAFDEHMTARTVSFAHSTSSSSTRTWYSVTAKSGVILAAGALGSAPILERSGIGRSSVLAAAGVTQKIELPGVGVNLNVIYYVEGKTGHC